MGEKTYIYFNVETLTFVFSNQKKSKKKYISFSREDLIRFSKKNISSTKKYIIKHKIDSSFFYFSSKIIKKVTIDTEPSNDHSIYKKPSGMWLSFGSSWLDYIERYPGPNKYNLFTYTYKVELFNTVKIITDKDGLFAFIKKYKKKADDIRIYDIIDWEKVKSDFNGLIITPHLGTKIWRDNFESFYIHGNESAQDFFTDVIGPKWKNNNLLLSEWYRGWSCASGVIWNIDAIANIQLIKKTDYPKYIKS